MSLGTDATTDSARAIVTGDSSTRELLSGGLVAISFASFVFSLLAVAQYVPADATVGGVTLATVLGGALAVVGLGVVVLGAASYAGAFETEPGHTGGLVSAAFVGALWFAVGGLIGAQTLGLSALWPVVALAAGGVGGGVALFAREDLGVTLSTGLFVLLSGLVVLTGLVGPGWQWSPEGFSITVPAVVGIPVITLFAALVGAWTAARVYGGFGPQGRQLGAHMLIGTNAAGMLALLGSIVGFILVRGFSPMTEGIEYGLFWGPWTWFNPPLVDTWVVVEGPIVWFYWPFVMEGYSTLGAGIDGVLPAIVGTVWLVAGAIAFAVPLGVGAAVFLTEYAEEGRFTFLVEISTNGLWSTPSIVYGLFGLAFLVPRLGNTNSILAGQLVLGFMLLPLVVITSRESLKSVPDEYRDASAALGVSKWETIKSVVLPASLPGVITGVILGVGRIAGETAPILLVTTSSPFPSEVAGVIEGGFRFTSAFPFVAVPDVNLIQSSSALPYQLFAVIGAGLGENLDFAWGTALVLLLVVMSFYAVGVTSRIYFRRKLDQ
ncbi:phosphate ABC transporter permease [Halosimplex carlsbadense 2-9-1]|uniref:Phosphate transport system permease protein PstA n=1 Tax=Halosimplex carlsbadense 2-9-1 TaxID=797114 RepID=M0CKM2_9EURY|nr:phosphate ABC transporter permease PstA [Halosimplex carlsbadense]ELZ23173.1 phosphate ABC transporter permease [Halosimplex carlsbadense 2-9-1]